MFASKAQWRKCFDMYIDDLRNGRSIRWDCKEWTFASKAYRDLPEHVQEKTIKKPKNTPPRRSNRLKTKGKINYKE